jgi:hypothetical protein
MWHLFSKLRDAPKVSRIQIIFFFREVFNKKFQAAFLFNISVGIIGVLIYFCKSYYLTTNFIPMLSLLNVTSKFRIVAMFGTIDSQQPLMQYIYIYIYIYIYTVVFSLRTKFHLSSSNGFSVTAITLKKKKKNFVVCHGM